MAIIAPSFHRSLCFALAISQWQSYQLPVTSSQFSLFYSLSLSPSPFHKLLPSLNASCILSFSSGSCLLLLLLKSATHFDAIKFAIRSDRWNNQWSLEISMGIYTKRVIEKCRRIRFIRQREKGEKVEQEWSCQPNRFVYLYFMLYLDPFDECKTASSILSNTPLPPFASWWYLIA